MVQPIMLLASLLLPSFSIAGPLLNPYSRLTLYAFNSDHCYGHPSGSSISIMQGECYNILAGARSVKPMVDKSRMPWVAEVNAGDTICALLIYKTGGCVEGEEYDAVALPDNIQQCIIPGEPVKDLSIYSVKFECGTRPKPNEDEVKIAEPTTYTTTAVATTWKIGAYDNKATPYFPVRTLTVTQGGEPSPASSPPKRLEPRNMPAKKWHSKGLQMLHPWALSVICYECYNFREEDWGNFECRSGPHNNIDCGPEIAGLSPDPDPPEKPENNDTLSGIEKRSWHRRVQFEHPYRTGVKVCADSEWEKRGTDESEIRIQEAADKLHKCKWGHAINIDHFPIPLFPPGEGPPGKMYDSDNKALEN